jgi:hypothetical protein
VLSVTCDTGKCTMATLQSNGGSVRSGYWRRRKRVLVSARRCYITHSTRNNGLLDSRASRTNHLTFWWLSLASQVSWPQCARLRFFGHSLKRKQMLTNQARFGSRTRTSGAKLELLGHGCLSAVLSGRGVCDGLITRPEESYRVYCV